MTRYERIMKMTLEELAEWMDSGDLHADCCSCAYLVKGRCTCDAQFCEEGRKMWLLEEYDEYGYDELPPLREEEEETR